MNQPCVAAPLDTGELHLYKLSEAVQLTATSDGGTVVKHLISERSYKLGSRESQVVHAMQAGAPLAAGGDAGIDAAFVASVLRFLRDKNIVVDRAHAVAADYLLIEPGTPCWGQPAALQTCQPGDVCYVGVPYGYGNGVSAATKEAPMAVRNWLRTHRLSRDNILNEPNLAAYFPPALAQRAHNVRALHQQQRVKDLGDLYIYPYENPVAVFGRLEKLAADLARRGVVPVFIGGDHSITCPILKGLSAQPGEFCVLHFDAHNDCYHTAIDALFAPVSNNHHGNFLSSALAQCAGIRQAYQWGVRGVNNLGAVLPARVVSRPAAELIHLLQTDQLAALPDGLPVYVTIDIDVLDPGIAPGTGSPIPGGITWEQLFLALGKLLRNQRVIGMDMVELDPGADARGVTMHGAAHLLSLLPGFVEAG